jgi:N-acetylmuramoyl-L-alanine amidase
MLDAGHNGKKNKSPCKTTPTYYESEAMWNLHNYLYYELVKRGFSVARTRDDLDEFMDVNERGKLAKGYDLFLSLHTNAAGSKVKEGTDRTAIIYPVNSEREVIKFADYLAACIESTIDTVQPFSNYCKSYDSDPDTDYYGVIRGAVAAGCKRAYIVEHTFHTDTRATKWLLSEDNLKELAKNMAETISEIFGEATEAVPFKAKISVTNLNIRKGPGTNYAKTGKYTGKGVFTIVEVQKGAGSESGWGKLKSGSGWISLDYAERVE